MRFWLIYDSKFPFPDTNLLNHLSWSIMYFKAEFGLKYKSKANKIIIRLNYHFKKYIKKNKSNIKLGQTNRTSFFLNNRASICLLKSPSSKSKPIIFVNKYSSKKLWKKIKYFKTTNNTQEKYKIYCINIFGSDIHVSLPI